MFNVKTIIMIEEDLLYQFGAEIKNYDKNRFIFSETSLSFYYFQIKKGTIKLNNYRDDGKEFIQNIFSDGQSFGESLLFIDAPYPMNAVSIDDSNIYQLPKARFFELLELHPQISVKLNKILSQRLYYKYIMIQNLSSSCPVTRLMSLMNYLKSFHHDHEKFSFRIPLTRQQMASLTGLCVETVIRNVKTLAKRKVIVLKNHKIYY